MKKVLLMIGLIALIACAPAQPAQAPSADNVVQQLEAKQEAMQEEMEEAHSTTMEAGLIAGDVSKYYNWDKALFDQAVAEGKTVYLEFSANWCSICKAQHAHLAAGFEELDDPNVIGFKIPYKDSDTTKEHEGLAKEYNVAYQHTKRIIKNGEVVLKSPESWEKDRFLEELRNIQSG